MGISTDSWRGDGERRLSPKVLRWFRARVREDLRCGAVTSGTPLPEATIDVLAEPFMADPTQWLCWRPDSGYRPGSYLAPGEWVPSIPSYHVAITAALIAHGIVAQRRDSRAALFPKVGDGALVPPPDIDVALAELAAEPASEVREPWAGFILEGPQRDAFHETRHRVQVRLEHPCSCCGAYFTGKVVSEKGPRRSRFAGPVCAECAAAHRRRCVGCGEVFTVDSGKQRRCESCRHGQEAAEAVLRGRKS